MDVWKITGFELKDWKGIKNLKIQPTGPIVLFTGKNKAGKTSALDALMYGLLGEAWCPPDPTRHGSKGYEVLINLEGTKDGQPMAFTVRRTPSLNRILMAPGCTAWDKTQRMLDDICDQLMLDPLEFIRVGKTAGKKSPGAKDSREGKREQVNMLRAALVFDVDIDVLDAENKKDFEARTAVGREVERLKGDIRNIPIPTQKLPDQPIDLEEIQARIRAAQQHNNQFMALIEARTRLAGQLADAELNEKRNQELIVQTHARIEKLTADHDAARPAASAAAKIQDGLAGLRERAEGLLEIPAGSPAYWLREKISEAHVRALAYVDAATKNEAEIKVDLDAARKTLQAAEKQRKPLSQAVAEARLELEQSPVPVQMDVPALTEELQNAISANNQLGQQQRRQELEKQLEAQDAEWDRLTRAMDDRKEQKAQAIKNAKMPIEGLTYTAEEGKQEIWYNDTPLSQLAESEQLRISIAVALARNPKLRVVRIPNGELLDDDSMEELIRIAEEQKFVIFMAKVDPSGEVGIFLEDSVVKSINPPIKKKRR